MLSISLHCKLTLIDSSFSMVYLKVRCILHIVKESWSPLDLVHPSCRYSMSQCIYVCLFFLPETVSQESHSEPLHHRSRPCINKYSL